MLPVLPVSCYFLWRGVYAPPEAPWKEFRRAFLCPRFGYYFPRSMF